MTAASISETRKAAWKTRCEKYGAKGHNGSYERPPWAHNVVKKPPKENAK